MSALLATAFSVDSSRLALGLTLASIFFGCGLFFAVLIVRVRSYAEVLNSWIDSREPPLIAIVTRPRLLDEHLADDGTLDEVTRIAEERVESFASSEVSHV